MDWNYFVELVSTTRLIVLGAALLLTVLLGAGSAIKAKAFSWEKFGSFLMPSGNFFGLIIGYVLTAGLAASVIPDVADPALVVTTYTFIVVAMVAKLKEQISFLFPSLPIANWKLPLEPRT